MLFVKYSTEEIIDILKNGRENSRNSVIKFLYDRNYRIIESFVLKNSGGEEDAKDVFQEGLTITYGKIIGGQFKGDSSIHTFIFSIIKNLWYNELRKRKKENSTPLGTIDVSEDQDTSILTGIDMFKPVFELLSEECKSILKYAFYENLSMKEIVLKFDSISNEQSARTKKYRCMRSLSRLMTENGITKESFQDG